MSKEFFNLGQIIEIRNDHPLSRLYCKLSLAKSYNVLMPGNLESIIAQPFFLPFITTSNSNPIA